MSLVRPLRWLRIRTRAAGVAIVGLGAAMIVAPVSLNPCGQFWRVRGNGRCPGIGSARDVLAFDRPGYAKATINFRVVPEGDGCRLTTETRIAPTDSGARWRFGAYWRLIYPGSSLIRVGWLEAIKRRAESPEGALRS